MTLESSDLNTDEGQKKGGGKIKVRHKKGHTRVKEGVALYLVLPLICELHTPQK